MVCRLFLFGPPQLIDENGRPLSVPAKAYALIAYLVLTSRGGPAPRSALRQFLWENSSTKTAATNLRKFLSRVMERQEQDGYELIRSRRDHVELAPSVKIDLAEFLRCLSERPPCDIITLCELYRGDLLENFELTETEAGFGSWLEIERTKLRDAFISAVARRIEPIQPDADRVQLRVAARRLIEVDPYNEAGHRTLMRLYAEDGEPARVRDTYLNLRQRLSEDLEVEPDAATETLFKSLIPARTQQPPTVPPQPRQTPVPEAAVAAAPDSDDASDTAAAAAARGGTPKVTILPPPPVAGQDYRHQLAVSLIEDVTINICRHRTLSVVAPYTASQLNVGEKRSLFRTFGINYAVETRLQNRGGDFWLLVKIINAITHDIVAMDQHAFDVEPAAKHYRDLSVQILTTVVDKIERAELERYGKEQHHSAYHLYLNGQRHLHTFDLPSVRRARRAFKAAIGDCSDFVPALSGLAKTYHLEWLLLARGENELLAEAERLAKLSLQTDPDDARGYRELGVCSLYTGRFDESLEAFALAEARHPRFADLLMDYSDALTHAGEPAKALEKITSAIELNPLCPDSYWWAAGGASFHLQRYADAIESISRMRDQSPAYRLLAASYAQLGLREEAAEYVRRVKEIHPEFKVSNWLSMLPVRDRQYERDYEEGLREAGFD